MFYIRGGTEMSPLGHFKDKQGGKRIMDNSHNLGICNNIMKREQISLRKLLAKLISKII